MNNDDKIKTEEELVGELDSLLSEVKGVRDEIKEISKDFEGEIKSKEEGVAKDIKEISEGLAELDQIESDAEADFEKLMMEEAEKIAEEEKDEDLEKTNTN